MTGNDDIPETLSSHLDSSGDSINSYRAALEVSEVRTNGASNLTIEKFGERCSRIIRSLRVQEKTSLDSIHDVNQTVLAAFQQQCRRNATNGKLTTALTKWVMIIWAILYVLQFWFLYSRLIETFKDEYTVQRDAYSMGLYGLNSSQTADFPDMARPRIAECFLSAIDAVSKEGLLKKLGWITRNFKSENLKIQKI